MAKAANGTIWALCLALAVLSGAVAASERWQPEAAPLEAVPDDGDVADWPRADMVATPLPIVWLPPPARWYASLEGIALARDVSGERLFAVRVTSEQTEVVRVDQNGNPVFNGGNPVLVTVFTESATPVLGTDHFRTDLRGGGRAVLGLRLDEWYAMEACYFGLREWSGQATVRDDTPITLAGGVTYPASLTSPFFDFGIPLDQADPGYDFNSLAAIGFESSLESLEWNLRRELMPPGSRLYSSVLVGGRYLNVRERFDYRTESAVAVNQATTNTSNDMVGVQVGTLLGFYIEPRFDVAAELKAGAFNNATDQETVLIHTENGTQVHATSGGRAAGTVALELAVIGNWQLSPAFSVRCGYHMLWIDGLALAAENLGGDVNLLMTGPAEIVDSGEVLYHGPRLGGVFAW